MKKVILSAIMALALPFLSASAKDYNALSQFRTIKCGGLERSYWLYVPEDMPENAPLIICMKGYSSKPKDHPGFGGFMELADKEKFAVVVPKACGNEKIGYGMNVGYAFQQDDETMKKVDDVKFLTKIIKQLQKEYKISRENVFCTGASNGGEMCYHLAYCKPDLFKAFAPEFGLTMTWLYKSKPLPKAVPLIELHGTRDHVSEWGGDPTNQGGWGEYISVPLAVSQFAVKAHCTHEICEELAPINPESTRKVFLHKYVGGDNGIEVWLYEIVGAGHGDFGDEIDMVNCIWEFFKKYM